MFTLKIGWLRFDEAGIQADETTLFIPADEVRVHGQVMTIDGQDTMQAWDPGDWFEYRNVHDRGSAEVDATSNNPTDVITVSLPYMLEAGRLILVVKDGVETWYTASRAWLLGPTGQTIERIAP